MHTISSQFRPYLMLGVLLASSCAVEISQQRGSPTEVGLTAAPSTSRFPLTRLPVTWGHLGLSGRLVYVSSAEDDPSTNRIQQLDLLTGEVAILYEISPAWIYYITLSPDATMLAMSYSPPRESTTSSGPGLYVLSLTAPSDPQPLFVGPTPEDRYTQVEWSPDGSYLYYVHYNQEQEAGGPFYESYDISRMSYPSGAHETLLRQAFWPRLSPDSSRLAYVSLDPRQAPISCL